MSLYESLRLYVSTNPRIQSDGTTKRYEATLSSLAKFLGREPTVDDLNPDTYGRWVRHRRDVVKVAPSTLHGECQKLLVLWRWLAKRNAVEPPDVMLPRKFETENITWLEDEYTRLEMSARQCEWFVGEVPAKIYFPAIIGLMVETGERLGAVYKLESHYFDFAKLTVHFPRTIRKGQTRDLVKRISLQTARDVQRLIEVRPTRPFAALVMPSLYHPLRRLLCDAGLPSSRNRLYHNFRRFHATRVAMMGGNAQRSLDHSDARTTERYIDRRQLGQEPMPERPKLPWRPHRWLRWLGL